MQAEGLVSVEQAIAMVEPRHLDQLLHPTFQDEAGYQKVTVDQIHCHASSSLIITTNVCSKSCYRETLSSAEKHNPPVCLLF